MNSSWQDFLHGAGFSGDFEHAGNAAAETLVAARDTVVAPLLHLGLIEASGADADSFLHNLLTNDINALPADGARRAGFCTPKGRLLADFLVWRNNGICLQLSADLLPPILKKLSMYVLRSKVTLADASANHVLIGLAGPDASRVLAGLDIPAAAALHTARFEHGIVIGLDAQRFELMVETAYAAALWQQLASTARPVGLGAWRRFDIAAGIPLVTAATSEQFVPQMINYELIGGVGFKKGCYPGQEIVARTQYLGKIKRRMYRARVDASRLDAGKPVYADETGDQACGMVVSAAPSPDGGTELLLVAQTSCVEGGSLHVETPAGPIAALLPLPYQVA